MNIFVKKLYDDAKLPSRAHHDDAGIDMYAHGHHEVAPRATVTIATGCACEIPFGYVGLMWDKSSTGKNGLKTLGGVIDAGYRGEVKIMLHNLSEDTYAFEHGDKVAQMLIQKVELWEVEESDELSETTRGTGAFGSTGK